MTKNELIKKTHERYRIYLRKDIAVATQAIFDAIADALKKAKGLKSGALAFSLFGKGKPALAAIPKQGHRCR